jgi:hypothetical protein
MKRKYFGAAVAALAAVALMAPIAQATTPAPGYTQFAGCPSPAENPIISACIHAKVTGGFVKLGNKEVPLEKPINLSGGTDEFLENFAANSKGGLEVVKEKVPGGVVGLTGLTWLLEILGSEALTLYAAAEAVGQPQLHSFNSVTLPVRIHLINSALGNNCYVGSPANPVIWNLNTATSPGVPVKLSFTEVPEIAFAKGGKFVDKTFSAPGATGCVLTLFGFIPVSINGIVNAASGLPATSGNETQQTIEEELAGSEKVYP